MSATSGLSFLIHGVISLQASMSYDKLFLYLSLWPIVFGNLLSLILSTSSTFQVSQIFERKIVILSHPSVITCVLGAQKNVQSSN